MTYADFEARLSFGARYYWPRRSQCWPSDAHCDAKRRSFDNSIGSGAAQHGFRPDDE